MGMNLIDPAFKFQTSIVADCPTYRDFTVETLSDPAGKGFLAASFKKPPVTFFISFLHPLAANIHKIIFRPKILSQCSTAANINVLPTNRDKLQRAQKWMFGLRASWDPDTDYVIFENPHYRSHGILPQQCNYVFHPLPNTKQKVFQLPKYCVDIAALAITITSTKDSTSVAMKNLVISGQPSMKIGRKEYEEFARSIFPPPEEPQPLQPVRAPAVSVPPPSTHLGIVETTLTRQDSAPSSSDSRSKRLFVPEEFLDPLTFLLILDPVILPSGITVDLSTLRKHETAQAEYGRNLFDPYTGKHLDYKDLRANLQLRQRIIEFLYKNKEQLLKESTESERTRLADFLKSREGTSGGGHLMPADVVINVLDCRACHKETGRNSMYEYPCGYLMCRECAVQRSFGTRTEQCSVCKRYHTSSDIKRCFS